MGRPAGVVQKKYVLNKKIWIGLTGPNLYKEDRNSYEALHYFIRKRLLNLNKCSDPYKLDCINLPTDIDNISGNYNSDLSDWRWVCHPCNMKNPITRFRISEKSKIQLRKTGWHHSEETKQKNREWHLGRTIGSRGSR